jgi:AcrR family transcriptional regulator
VTNAAPTVEQPARATPLAPEDRRSKIIDAVLPLVLENGGAVTSRQIAEAAGVAEGTVFRAFGDKDSLIRAAVTRYLDPAPLLAQLAAIDPARPLDEKIRLILSALRSRFAGVFRIMSALKEEDRPVPVSIRDEVALVVADILGADAKRLAWTAAQVAQLARLLAFASSFPLLTEGSEFTDDELAELVLHGITGSPDTVRNTHAR